MGSYLGLEAAEKGRIYHTCDTPPPPAPTNSQTRNTISKCVSIIAYCILNSSEAQSSYHLLKHHFITIFSRTVADKCLTSEHSLQRKLSSPPRLLLPRGLCCLTNISKTGFIRTTSSGSFLLIGAFSAAIPLIHLPVAKYTETYILYVLSLSSTTLSQALCLCTQT